MEVQSGYFELKYLTGEYKDIYDKIVTATREFIEEFTMKLTNKDETLNIVD